MAIADGGMSISVGRRMMTRDQREELVGAIERREIGNASEYAAWFADRHDLNAETIRSTISRYRRELGLLERRQNPRGRDRESAAEFEARITRLCELDDEGLAAVQASLERQQRWIEKALALVDLLRGRGSDACYATVR